MSVANNAGGPARATSSLPLSESASTRRTDVHLSPTVWPELNEVVGLAEEKGVTLASHK